MPRILKRPMFSRGGSTNENNGIMDGLVDRKELNKGTSPFTEERTSADVKAMMDAMNTYAPVNKGRLNLGKVGLNLAAGKYSGGDLISSLAGAGSDIYDDYTTKDDAYRAAIAKRKQAAVSSSLSQQIAEKTARDKAKLTSLKPGALKKAYDPNKINEDGSKGGIIFADDYTIRMKGLTPVIATKTTTVNPGGGIELVESYGGAGEKKGDPKSIATANELRNTTFQMNNVANNLITNLSKAQTGPVGGVIQTFDSLGAQLKQTAQVFGFKTTGKDKTYDDTGSGAIDEYISKNFNLKEGAVNYGKVKSATINLAYLMARIDEPGGRFTDRDIALKMEEMGIGPNPERTIEVLKNAILLRNSNAQFAYKTLTGLDMDLEGMNLVGEKEKKQFFREGPDGVYRFYETEKD